MDSIKSWLTERNIAEVEAVIPDMSGVARGKILPAQKFSEEEGMRLPEAILLQTITGDYPRDASAIHPADIDILLRPDAATIRLIPWAIEPSALVIHDCYYADGKPVKISPRYVLRRILKLYHDKGWQPVVAPELEFYLVKPNTDADYPLEPPVGRSGRPETGRQAYSIDALNEFGPLFDDIYDWCQAQGLKIDTLIHEAGAAQMEVNLLHGDPLDLADQAFLFKRTVREAALRHNMYATFMGKPMEGQPGSSMHIHHSVVDRETGSNIFSNDNGDASARFFCYIGGLQKYLPAAMCIFAPNVNSYRRIIRFHAAPINVQWGYDNRTAGLRIPVASAEARRVENRVAGADANPYLAIAASLACGYLGMMEERQPTEPVEGSAYELSYELPRNLEEALRSFRNSKPLSEALGEKFVTAYGAVKESEYEAFLDVISSWEREHLLLNV